MANKTGKKKKAKRARSKAAMKEPLGDRVRRRAAQGVEVGASHGLEIGELLPGTRDGLPAKAGAAVAGIAIGGVVGGAAGAALAVAEDDDVQAATGRAVRKAKKRAARATGALVDGAMDLWDRWRG